MSSIGHLSPHPPGRLLSTAGRRLGLTVHVVASVALLGVSAALLVLALSAAGSGAGSAAHATYDLMETLVFALSVPLALTALASGLVLGLGSGWGVWRTGWVRVKLLLLLAVVAMGILAVRFWVGRLADSTGPGAPATGATPWLLAGALVVNVLALATATALSIYRPRRRARTPAAAPATPEAARAAAAPPRRPPASAAGSRASEGAG